MGFPKRFKVWILALSFFLLFAIVSLFFFQGKPSRVTKENVDRIQVGMTKLEVIAILGKPDTEIWRGLKVTVKEGREVWNEGRNPRTTSGAMIDMDFNEEDRVVTFCWFPPSGSEPSFLERLISWIN